MSTILRLGRTRVVIYANDHRPAHVHALRGRDKARFILNCPDGPVKLAGQTGFGISEIRSLGEMITEALSSACFAWSQQHGDF